MAIENTRLAAIDDLNPNAEPRSRSKSARKNVIGHEYLGHRWRRVKNMQTNIHPFSTPFFRAIHPFSGPFTSVQRHLNGLSPPF